MSVLFCDAETAAPHLVQPYSRTIRSRACAKSAISTPSRCAISPRASLAKATIVNIEAGRVQPHPTTVRKLAAALGVPARQLLLELRPRPALVDE